MAVILNLKSEQLTFQHRETLNMFQRIWVEWIQVKGFLPNRLKYEIWYKLEDVGKIGNGEEWCVKF